MAEKDRHPGEPRQRIDIAEFIRDGYLQEANRRFFHPLGLALEATAPPGGQSGFRVEMSESSVDAIRWLLKRAVEEGIIAPAWPDAILLALDNATQLDPDARWLGGVWDGRDDPEGIYFPNVDDPEHTQDTTDDVRQSKRENIDREWVTRSVARLAALGYMVQPLP